MLKAAEIIHLGHPNVLSIGRKRTLNPWKYAADRSVFVATLAATMVHP
jgi:hypothetical protein